MNAKKSKTEEREFSESLRLLISAEFIQAHPDLTLVTGNDLEVLKNIVKGESKPSFPVDRKRAITALTRSESSAEVTDILTAILSNRDETESNRSLAAHGLSAMPVAIAEKNLLKNLIDENSLVRAEIIKSLSRIGTDAALEQLNKLRFPGELDVQQQLSLAKLLISMRTNPDEISPGKVREILGIAYADQKTKTIKAKELKPLITQLGSRNFGVSLNTNVGYVFNCAGPTHYLLLNAELKQGKFIGSLQRKALIAGIVVASTDGLAHSTPRYIVLTLPTKTGIEVIVTRVNGEAIYNGIVSKSDNILMGNLRDIGIERTPTQIEVTINDSAIDISSRLWRGIAKNKKPGRLLDSV